MNTFAKLFTLEDCQVVVMKQFDAEDSPEIRFYIQVSPNVDTAEISLSYYTVVDRDNAFNKVTDKEAHGAFLEIKKLYA